MRNPPWWLALGLVLAIGCARRSPPPDITTEPAPVTVDQHPAADAAAVLESVDRPIAAVKRFPELERLVFTTLQFQRMVQLQDDDVQRALQLTPEQAALFTREGAEAQRLLTDVQRTKPDDREARFASDFLPAADRIAALLESELTATQRQQLLERIVRGQRGAIALVLPGVPEQLELSAEQRAAIFAIMDETRRSTDFDRLHNPLEVLKLVRRSTVAREAAEQQLTAEQRARWNELLGK